jgi:thiol-disulfide isomerase/thioredoxin
LQFIVLAGFAFFQVPFAPAAESSGSDELDKPSAAELVQGVIDAENKIRDVKSLYLRYEGKWTRTTESIATEREELRNQFPGREIEDAKHSSLWPVMTEEHELAFDERRVRKLTHWHNAHRDLRIFDGAKAVGHSKYFTNGQESYFFPSEARELFENYFLSLSWLRLGTPAFWFEKHVFAPSDRARINGYPQDYSLEGEASLHGRTCYVLVNPAAYRRLYVDVDDRRLHQIDFHSHEQGTDVTAAQAAAAGRTFSNQQELREWLKGLSPDAFLQYDQKFRRAMFPLTRRTSSHYLDDYREIAPGIWTPGVQGYDIYRAGNQAIQVSRELRLVEAKVNQSLADDLFQLKLEDGVQVADGTYDPPLFYKYKANRTAEEFQELIDQTRNQNDAWNKQNAVRDALIGQPAPALPSLTWLNGPALDWAALKGQVVLLDFWGTTCGPCRNDLPRVEELHNNKEGIVAIGVHTDGSEADEVASFAKEMKLTYPITIDQPSEGRSSFGRFFDALGIHAIPYSFVVDRDGNIAAHGNLQEVLAKARELAAQAPKHK